MKTAPPLAYIAATCLFLTAPGLPYTLQASNDSETAVPSIREMPPMAPEPPPDDTIEAIGEPEEIEEAIIPAPDKADIHMLARLIWGEARGVPSATEKAAVAWCVLNRVDSLGWPDTIAEVVTQKNQFTAYSPDYPATAEFIALASDVLVRWMLEKEGAEDVGRVLPMEYHYFTGYGGRNHFRRGYNGTTWDWGLESPYED